jgi:hypothetical protein
VTSGEKETEVGNDQHQGDDGEYNA